MKEHKDIDRLFQEKFKDFEAQPSSRVWEGIAARQNKKESKRLLPFWWKIGGIAASLLLTLGLGILYFSPNPSEDQIVVSATGDAPKQTNTNNSNVTTTNYSTYESARVANVNSSNSSRPNKESLQNQSRSVAPGRNNIPKDKSSQKIKSTTINKDKTPQIVSPYSYQIVQNKTNPKSVNVLKGTLNENNLSISKVATEDSIDTNTIKKDLIAEVKKQELKKLEDDLPEENETSKTKKWNVGAVAAPVYYSDLGGSGIGSQFADNSKTGDVNLSYGIQVSYEIAPKIAVRAGVNSLDLSYSTNEISFSTSGVGKSLASVNTLNDVSTLVIADGNNKMSSAQGFAPQAVGTTSNGSIKQQLSYVEIPMEAVYTISDKRVGFTLVGGISTLLLNNNQVILASEELTTNLGNSTAVNNVSFTSNFGMGIDYKLTEDLKLNFEPQFKYQLNGFDTSEVNFRPYYLGVYTGLSYKF